MKAGEARAVLSKLLQRRATAEVSIDALAELRSTRPTHALLGTRTNSTGQCARLPICQRFQGFQSGGDVFPLCDGTRSPSKVRSFRVLHQSYLFRYVIPVRPSTLIYHTALSQLAAGRPKSAFYLFCAVWPFHHDNPRTWLRIAECCMQVGNAVSNADECYKYGFSWAPRQIPSRQLKTLGKPPNKAGIRLGSWTDRSAWKSHRARPIPPRSSPTLCTTRYR